MNILRKLAGLIFALALTAITTPAMAQQLKTFALGDAPAYTSYFVPFANFGTALSVTSEIRVINNSPTTKSNYNSFRIFAPPGFKITAATPVNNASSANSVTPFLPQFWQAQDSNNGRSYVEVRGISPSIGNTGTNNSFGLSLTVERGCVAPPLGEWLVQVYSGGDLSGAQFAFKNPNTGAQLAWPTSTAVDNTTGSCQPKVMFVPAREPKSQLKPAAGAATITAEANLATGNAVQAQVMIGNSVNTNYQGPIQISITSGPNGFLATDLTATATNGIATFDPRPTVDKVGFYTMVPKTSTLTGTDAQTILVSDGTLNCTTNRTVPSSVTGADWEVTRLQHDQKAGCTAVNYLATSGGTNAIPKTDPAGFILGTDFFSIVYNTIPGEGVLLKQDYISSPYPMVGGLAQKKKIMYCKQGTTGNPAVDMDCALAANLVQTPGCLSGSDLVAAIPIGHPGCQQSFGWFTVAQSECSATPNDGTGCVRYQFQLLEAKDPPWGMTDE